MIRLKPKVTVLAPVFNGEKYICGFIESILRQDYDNWELILIDDGSADSTVQLVRQYDDIRIKLIERPDNRNKGANTCRNIGIDHISGKYFIILDSDDLVEEYCLKQRVEFMEGNSSVDMGIFPGKSIFTDENGKLTEGNKIWGKRTKTPPIIPLLKADYNFGVWNAIFRSESMSGILWDEKLKIYMDFDYLFRILINDYHYAYAEDAKPDYGYIQGRSNAITSSFVSEEKYLSTKYLFNKTISELSRRNEKKYINFYYYFFLSFFKKIVHSGNYEMYLDYLEYFKKAYHNKSNFRLKLLDAYCNKKIKNNDTIGKSFDYLMIALFYPLDVIPKLFAKVFTKK